VGALGKFLSITASLAVLATASVAIATVPPLTPEGRVRMERMQALEDAARNQFGDPTTSFFREAYGNVIVADEVDGRPAAPKILIKDEFGWHELRGAKRLPLPDRAAHELNRLLISEALPSEDPYLHKAPCERPRVFILRHAGRESYGRQCQPFGLAGRAALVAATYRVPAGRGETTASPPPPQNPRPGSGAGEDLMRHIHHRASDMVWAWERRSLAGAVDPYAEHVVVEMPGRVLRGRAALVEWLRPQQDWATRGIGKKVDYHRGSLKPPEKDVIFEMREIRWEEHGRPMRRTYSATWKNDGGLWQIVHEKVSEDKPVVEGERHIW
jgi:hypothetical protein